METSPKIHHEEEVLTNEEAPLEYEARFGQIRDDLKYMFQIEVRDEDELTLPRTKERMYKVALAYLEEENPFGFEYFVDEALLSKEDIKTKDKRRIKELAIRILEKRRNAYQRTRCKDMFLTLGVLTQKELEMIS